MSRSLRPSIVVAGLVCGLGAACDPASGPAAREAAATRPPPVTFDLAVTPVLPGAPVTLSVSGAPPGVTLHLGRGAWVGAGPCLPMLGGGCLDLVAPLGLLGTAPTSAGGALVLAPTAPPSLPWGPVAFQAVRVAGASTEMSTPVQSWIQQTGVVSRGTWFWRDTGHPDGAGAVVGDPAAEALTLQRFDAWSIDRVYASYDWASPTAVTDIAAWHMALHATPGRSVFLLLSENTWIDPLTWPNLDSKLQERLADFHASVVVASRFDGVHLDIEPHGLPDWSTLSAADKRGRLDALLATWQHVRTWMDTHGAAALPLYADIPVWWDNLPGSIGWSNAADRDTWFAAACGALTGVTLMDFQRDSVASIQSGIDGERSMLTCEARVGVEARMAPMATPTWDDLNHMMTTAAMWEDAYGVGGEGVDIQSWTQFVDPF
ncbi:MAG: hypothetical protein H6733_10065 [Alphaproteobacteria bacterium]|nr:hypothetical protein [Alphaproteobacteria bacterium]